MCEMQNEVAAALAKASEELRRPLFRAFDDNVDPGVVLQTALRLVADALQKSAQRIETAQEHRELVS